jgi:hypothetical protein
LINNTTAAGFIVSWCSCPKNMSYLFQSSRLNAWISVRWSRMFNSDLRTDSLGLSLKPFSWSKLTHDSLRPWTIRHSWCIMQYSHNLHKGLIYKGRQQISLDPSFRNLPHLYAPQTPGRPPLKPTQISMSNVPSDKIFDFDVVIWLQILLIGRGQTCDSVVVGKDAHYLLFVFFDVRTAVGSRSIHNWDTV